MLKSKNIFVFVTCMLLIFTLSSSEGNQKAQVKNELVRLRAIQTGTGPQLEIKAGDFVCTTSQMTVRRKQGKLWTVKPVNGQVQMQCGELISTAGQVEIALRF
ncbi:hypothetical protein [Gimesia panareensis]|uniref:hypothetical protein n=1 Tax=Gimesia panareensis TaxID=2527978 RepID=UPI00118C8360|nr:hypothetical protein [Gimesia panareensis]QDU52025.1 hypothetical protein Pan110_43950 [Gimesia panareensis]